MDRTPERITCTHCGGSGESPTWPGTDCRYCDGFGYTYEEEQ